MSLEKGFGGRFKEGFEMFGSGWSSFPLMVVNDKSLALTTGSDQVAFLQHEGASMALNVAWACII